MCKDGFSGNGMYCEGALCMPNLCCIILINLADVNECESFLCDVNANCTNTVGSYSCQCNSGFVGNGVNCTG